MERNFLKRKVFRLNRPVAAKTGFPPFASRSLPFRQLRGSNPGCKPGRARKRTRKKDGFCASKSRSMRSMQASGLQARPCAEAHTKKKTGFAQAKAAACEACRHPGCKPGRARKRTRKKDGFCASKSRSMRSMQASGLQARPCAEAHTKKRRVLRIQFTVLNTKNLCSAGSGILQQSAVQFLFLAQAKYLQFSDRSKVFYHLCVLQEFFPIPP